MDVHEKCKDVKKYDMTFALKLHKEKYRRIAIRLALVTVQESGGDIPHLSTSTHMSSYQ